MADSGGRNRLRKPTLGCRQCDLILDVNAALNEVLQKSFCGMGLKFSEAWARRLNNDVGDHVATRQTHRRFWQRVCGSIERRLSLVSFFGENLAAAAFGTFATLSAQSGLHKRTDECPLIGGKADIEPSRLEVSFWTHLGHGHSRTSAHNTAI